MTTSVPAISLQKGDLCLPFMDRIEGVQRAGLKIPAGKVRVILVRPNGKRTVSTWNAQTLIKVEREEVLA